MLGNLQKSIYVHASLCLHYPEEGGGEPDEKGLAGVGRAYEGQGVRLDFDLVGNSDKCSQERGWGDAVGEDEVLQPV